MGIATNSAIQMAVETGSPILHQVRTGNNTAMKALALTATAMSTVGTLAALNTTQAHADTVDDNTKVTKIVTPTTSQDNSATTQDTSVQTTTKNVDYTIVSGDSLFKIAQEHNTTVQNLLDMNKDFTKHGTDEKGLSIDTTIYPGDTLHVGTEQVKAETQNTDPSIHVATEGETLDSIASSHNLTHDQIVQLNTQYQDGHAVQTGDKVTVQGIETTTTTVQNGQTASTQAVSGNTQTATPTQGSTISDSSIVNTALKYANNTIPYVWGGKTPAGFDCSGFVSYVVQEAIGKSLPSYTVAMENYVTPKAVSDAQPGDLLFWGGHGSTYHVAIYLGNGQFAAAPQPGENVKVQTISSYFMPSFAASIN